MALISRKKRQVYSRCGLKVVITLLLLICSIHANLLAAAGLKLASCISSSSSGQIESKRLHPLLSQVIESRLFLDNEPIKKQSYSKPQTKAFDIEQLAPNCPERFFFLRKLLDLAAQHLLLVTKEKFV